MRFTQINIIIPGFIVYGRFIDSLSVKEALFILDPEIYEYDIKQFREYFKKWNKNQIKIEGKLKEILENKFKININKIPKDENRNYKISDYIEINIEFKEYSSQSSHLFIIILMVKKLKN